MNVEGVTGILFTPCLLKLREHSAKPRHRSIAYEVGVSGLLLKRNPLYCVLTALAESGVSSSRTHAATTLYKLCASGSGSESERAFCGTCIIEGVDAPAESTPETE